MKKLPHFNHARQLSMQTMPDGKKLRTACWGSNANSRAIIVIVNGRGEYIEKYSEFIDDLLKRDFAIYSLDHRGQGLSYRPLTDRSKCYIENFDIFSYDLNEFISKKVLSDSRSQELPLYLIGHSMGAHICLRYLHDFPGTINKAVLMVPMIKFMMASHCKTKICATLIQLATGLGFGKFFALGQGNSPFSKQRLRAQQSLTHDDQRYQMEEDILKSYPSLYVGGVTFGWLKSALDSIKKITTPHFLDEISIPIQVILAGADTVVDNHASLTLFSGHDNIEIVTIDGARHEIYRESDLYRDKLWRAIDDFLAVQ